MKKQYTYWEYKPWKYTIELYHNGNLVHEEERWEGDDLNNYLDTLEKEGYTLGYTVEEVEQAKKEYALKLSNQISCQ